MAGANLRRGQAVASLGSAAGCSRRSRTRRRSWALAATMIVDRLMATAPTAIGRSIPQGTSPEHCHRVARMLVMTGGWVMLVAAGGHCRRVVLMMVLVGHNLNSRCAVGYSQGV